jgi:MraZ protein
MFIGKYYYTLQAKGRISLPKKFREQGQQWVVTRGLDGCLFIFKAQDFAKEVNKISQRSFTKKANRDLIRIMSNEAERVEADSNGRVQLPKYLISYAQLKKDLVIVGSFNRIEVWSRDHYHRYLEQIEGQAEQIAETVQP